MQSCKECDLFIDKYRFAIANYIEQLQNTLIAAESSNMAAFENQRAHELQLQRRYIQAQDFWISHQKQHPTPGMAKKMGLKLQ
jgi:hypothetical protein